MRRTDDLTNTIKADEQNRKLNVKVNKNENIEFEKYEKEFDELFDKNFNKPSLLDDQDK